MKTNVYWAWKWGGCRRIDPRSIRWKKSDVKHEYQNKEFPQMFAGKIVKVVVKEL